MPFAINHTQVYHFRFANNNSSIDKRIKSKIIKNGWPKFKSFKIKYPKTKTAIKNPLRLLFKIKEKRENINKNRIVRVGARIEN